MHWTLLLILSIALGYFVGSLVVDAWLVLQANWIRRASGRTLGLRLALWGLATDFPSLIGTLAAKIPLVRAHVGEASAHITLGSRHVILGLLGFWDIAMVVLYLATVFVMRSDMEDEPIGLSLGGVMTFFFGPYYFQYWLQDYVFTRLRSPSVTGIPATSPEPSA